MTVRLTLLGGHLEVEAPLHAEFLLGAAGLSGEWTGDTWLFPASHEQRVRKLCWAVYGTDGSPAEDAATVSLGLMLNPAWRVLNTNFELAGRTLFSATSVTHRGGAQPSELGIGVVVIRGSVLSDGSWIWSEGATTVRVDGLPAPAVKAAIALRSEADRFSICALADRLQQQAGDRPGVSG